MQRLAYLLVSIGFLLGSLLAVQAPSDQVRWSLLGPALLLGFAGVVLARMAGRRRSRQADTLQSSSQQLLSSLDRIVDHLTRLDSAKEGVNLHEMHDRIDTLFRKDLAAFAEARDSIIHSRGLEVYAAVMNEFAAGERYLNRVWSASVDGYVDEAHDYLARARVQFERARLGLREL